MCYITGPWIFWSRLASRCSPCFFKLVFVPLIKNVAVYSFNIFDWKVGFSCNIEAGPLRAEAWDPLIYIYELTCTLLEPYQNRCTRFDFFAPVCSSWTWVNRGTSSRSLGLRCNIETSETITVEPACVWFHFSVKLYLHGWFSQEALITHLDHSILQALLKETKWFQGLHVQPSKAQSVFVSPLVS